MQTTKREMIDLLKQNVLLVQFHKIANPEEIRLMRCTLNPKIVPPLKNEKEVIDATTVVYDNTKNDDLVKVYDMDKNDWRSFRLSTVERCQTIGEI